MPIAYHLRTYLLVVQSEPSCFATVYTLPFLITIVIGDAENQVNGELES